MNVPLLDRFFKDKTGRIVLWQWPKLPLYGWIVFKGLSLVLDEGNLKHGVGRLSTAFLFVWAYLELTAGVNYFRRLLGLVVLALTVWNYFSR